MFTDGPKVIIVEEARVRAAAWFSFAMAGGRDRCSFPVSRKAAAAACMGVGK